MSKDECESDEEIENTPTNALKRRIDLDDLKSRLTAYFLKEKIYSYKLFEVPTDYYKRPLEERRDLLGISNKAGICKSVIVENTAFDENIKCEIYKRYYLIVVQYTNEFYAEGICRNLKAYINKKYNIKIPKSKYHLRVCDKKAAYDMTGFTFNGIGPYLMKENDMFFIFPLTLYRLYPNFFTLGGGHRDLKVGVSVSDFMKLFGDRTIVLDTDPEKEK